MARVPYLDRADLAPEDRDIYDDLLAQRGEVINLFRALAHTPGLLRRLLGYSTALRQTLRLDPWLRELAILTVGRVTGVEYEFTHHWHIARSLGVPREKLEALEGSHVEDSPLWTGEERAVVRYSAEVTRGVATREETFRALRRFLDVPRLVELVQVVAYYNMIVRILGPLEIDLEPERTR